MPRSGSEGRLSTALGPLNGKIVAQEHVRGKLPATILYRDDPAPACRGNALKLDGGHLVE